MVIKKENIIRILLGIGILILAFMLIRSCNNEKAAIAAQKTIERTANNALADNDLLRKQVSDMKRDAAATDTLIVDLTQAKEDAEGALINMQDSATGLAKKIKEASNKKDTPYLIKSCPDLADVVMDLQVKSAYLKFLNDSLGIAYRKRRAQDSMLVSALETGNQKLADSIKFIAKLNRSMKITGKVKVGISGVFGPVSGIGPALAYQDKRDREYQGSVKWTNYGKIYEANVLFPISLKRKR